ncbi:MAG: aldo/keto reductase [Acidobacteria bacterium]|nr:aldo/keto reductase [Acidobacteriota bacterium]
MVDRRSFLRNSAAGLALGLTPALRGQDGKPVASAPPPKARTVVKRPLGKTGVTLPVVSMGVMNADNPNLVRAALEGGIVHFDTAHGYMRGRNEEMLGEVFKGVKRERFVLATKVVATGGDRATGLFTADTKPEAFIETFHLSLKRLQMDHVDILYLHNVTKREAVLFEPILKALQQLKKEGKTRFIGVSTHGNEPEVIRAAAESKVYDVVLTAYNYRQAHHAEVKAACCEAVKAGLGIVAMKTQAGGRFSRGQAAPVNMKAALKWALQDPCITTAIPGFTTFDQLAEDLTVMENLALTEGEKLDLSGAAKATGLYCQQCATCLPQCPQGLPIPDLMRGYMYAAGYHNLLQAKDLVHSLALPESPCAACGTCAVGCVQGFEVRPRIEELMSLRTLQDAFLV